MTFDPAQRFLGFVPGGNGVLYGIQADGDLLWYRHNTWTTGTASWANGGNGRTIGTFWHQFDTVLADSDGTLFAFTADGNLLWYKYVVSNLSTGAGSWHPNSGTQIGSDWKRFARVFGGFNGVIYGVDDDGNLFWYRYAGGNGSAVWGANSGAQIGSGWKPFGWLSADPNGVIFGWEMVDVLNWWRYVVDLNTGVGEWANGGDAIQIGSGWGETFQKTFISNTAGTIYAFDLDNAQAPGDDNTLSWYRLLTSENVDTQGATWANGGFGNQVGVGFTQQRQAALQGYPASMSAPTGGSVGVKVSTTFSSYTSHVVRLAPATDAPVSMGNTVNRTGRFQALQSGYRSAGCGWNTSFTVAVGATWPSGVYAAQLQSPSGTNHDVTFVVRPATPRQPIAVIIPTNTYNAYNTWGGHDQYTVGQDNVQRTVTLQRPNIQAQSATTGFINKGIFSDLFLLRWMTANNIQYDCYSDGDADLTGDTWMGSYKAVVLCSHAEYWTERARTNLNDYLQNGGRVVYTGGNGIYEKVTYTADRTAIVFRTPTGDRAVFDDLGEPADQILGVDYNAATYMDFQPYEVVADHPFLAGTGLTVGSTFGSVAYNVAASGWEVDASPGGISGQVVIAQGQNPDGGADMSYLPKPNGGWVFAASSINFNGSLPYDAAVRQIMANVFAAAQA